MDDNKASYKIKQNQTKWQSFKELVWNSDTGECFGRTGASWFKIFIFYVIFYACLAAFWTCMLVVFYQTLEEDKPKWLLDSSRIGSSPGLGFRPVAPDDVVDSTLIWFNSSKKETLDYWVGNLNKYLEPYEDSKQLGEGVVSCEGSQATSETKVCRFQIPKGTSEKCSSELQYGYAEKKPCVLVKLNRIYGWTPTPFDNPPEDLKKSIVGDYDPSKVYITCVGENAVDRDNIGDIEYYPSQGVDEKYFPFSNQPGYLSPFVFVRFANIEKNVLVNVECRAWAQNIVYNRGDRLGSVHFELLVD